MAAPPLPKKVTLFDGTDMTMYSVSTTAGICLVSCDAFLVDSSRSAHHTAASYLSLSASHLCQLLCTFHTAMQRHNFMSGMFDVGVTTAKMSSYSFANG